MRSSSRTRHAGPAFLNWLTPDRALRADELTFSSFKSLFDALDVPDHVSSVALPDAPLIGDLGCKGLGAGGEHRCGPFLPTTARRMDHGNVIRVYLTDAMVIGIDRRFRTTERRCQHRERGQSCQRTWVCRHAVHLLAQRA